MAGSEFEFQVWCWQVIEDCQDRYGWSPDFEDLISDPAVREFYDDGGATCDWSDNEYVGHVTK